MGWGGYYGGWAPYVPVAQRRAKAQNAAAKLAKNEGRALAPIKIEGRKITKTFWGQAWCDNLEAYSDFSNRLGRGKTYVRNGAVVDLVIREGEINALVAGSSTYRVSIKIKTLEKAKWKAIQRDCSTQIDSLLDLLAGQLNDGVMQRITRRPDGLFPSPKEIQLKCSCPDWAVCCKHVAAVMYGVGARLDNQPDLLFLLRKVKQQDLIAKASGKSNLRRELVANTIDADLQNVDLGEMFGIDLAQGAEDSPADSSRIDAAERLKPATKKRGTAGKKAINPSATKGKSPQAVPVRKNTAVKVAANKAAAKKPVAKTSIQAKPAKKKPVKLTKRRLVAK